MADQYQRPYLDSLVFIALIKNESVAGVERGQIARHLFTLAERGVFKICTSALTLAEVHKPRGGAALAEALNQRVLDFFEHDYIEIVNVDRLVGEHANRLCRRYGLRANDAIHVACAVRAACDVFLTWDRDFRNVQLPNLVIEEPQIRGQIAFDAD